MQHALKGTVVADNRSCRSRVVVLQRYEAWRVLNWFGAKRLGLLYSEVGSLNRFSLWSLIDLFDYMTANKWYCLLRLNQLIPEVLPATSGCNFFDDILLNLWPRIIKYLQHCVNLSGTRTEFPSICKSIISPYCTKLYSCIITEKMKGKINPFLIKT